MLLLDDTTKIAAPRESVVSDDPMAVSGDAQWFEYSKAANPVRPGLSPQMPFQAFLPDLYADGPTRLVPLDLSNKLFCQGPATSPGLCANFARILPGETLAPEIAADAATSRVFYVIRGSGCTSAWSGMEMPAIDWKEGDIVALPGGSEYVHEAGADGAAFYLVHDAPLLRHLGVSATSRRFEPTVYPAERTRAVLAECAASPAASVRSRVSVLFGNKNFPRLRTITHVIWAMFGIVPARSMQKPHRHQSVALDYIVSCGPGAYSLLGKELDSKGDIVKPVRQDWTPGMAFVTPPGFWHAHFNEGDTDAYLLPIQDAGLQTYLRSLDIRFG
jgi:gentisate 1,2-dioxygenase